MSISHRNVTLSVASHPDRLNGDNRIAFQIIIYPWVKNKITPAENLILGALLKGDALVDIAVRRNRDIRTISTQKKTLYRKLKICSDTTLYRDLLSQNAIFMTGMKTNSE
ncbi:hypothetical protein [Enterobacter cloacae]|uniref:hypothetical protein n=1 Tax=Enterobacter cloacae TaxID=550 RepID=UPI002FF5A44E